MLRHLEDVLTDAGMDRRAACRDRRAAAADRCQSAQDRSSTAEHRGQAVIERAQDPLELAPVSQKWTVLYERAQSARDCAGALGEPAWARPAF